MKIHDIEKSIKEMDKTYDANFGEWIRNEENSRIVGYNLRKYIDRYTSEELINALEWIVRDWTLRSILHLIKRMILDDIKECKDKKKNNEFYVKRVKIIQGIIRTWCSIFIAEFTLSLVKTMEIEEQVIFILDLFSDFSSEKIIEIIEHLDNKIEKSVQTVLIKHANDNKQKNKILNKLITWTKTG